MPPRATSFLFRVLQLQVLVSPEGEGAAEQYESIEADAEAGTVLCGGANGGFGGFGFGGGVSGLSRKEVVEVSFGMEVSWVEKKEEKKWLEDCSCGGVWGTKAGVGRVLGGIEKLAHMGSSWLQRGRTTLFRSPTSSLSSISRASSLCPTSSKASVAS